MDMISGLRDAAARNVPAGTAVASASGGLRPLHDDITAAFSLDGRVAVVTGAAVGIGRQTAITFAQAGATVVLADRDVEQLQRTADELAATGAVVLAVPTDVADRRAVDDLARAAVRLGGRIDVWANVAGIIRNSPVTELTEDDLDAILGVNLKGAVWGCAAAGRVMKVAKRGSIINVASAGGEMPAPTLAAYGTSKAGVIQLSRIVAAELGSFGVRCNSVAPGFVDTPMTQRTWVNPDGTFDEERRAAVVDVRSAQSPLATIGTPADIAHAMLFLAADASKFMTGQVLRPNGGVFMS